MLRCCFGKRTPIPKLAKTETEGADPSLSAISGSPWNPEIRTDQGWMDRHNSFVDNTRNNGGSINVLFYGDSIIEGWLGEGKETYNQYYALLGTANYGIGGDRTEHLLWRVINGEVTANLSPKLCVIQIGTNNLWLHDDHSIGRGVMLIVQELRERLPNMKILLLGVLPRTSEAGTRRTSAINEILQQLNNENTIRFLDMKDHFYRGGNDFVEELYTSDMLHLSAAGYRKWAEVMDPLFREMLN